MVDKCAIGRRVTITGRGALVHGVVGERQIVTARGACRMLAASVYGDECDQPNTQT